MDIRLFDVPNDFSAVELKLALCNYLQDTARAAKKDTDFDYLVILDYNTERLLWDQLVGTTKTYSALLILPDITIADSFLQKCSNKSVTIKSEAGSVYVVNAEKAKPQSTTLLEYRCTADRYNGGPTVSELCHASC
jgi:hypothetical protein